MNIKIYAESMSVNDGIKEHIEKKLQQIKGFDKHTKIEFKLKKEGLKNNASIELHQIGKNISSHSSHINMYSAIDNAIITTEKQLLKIKEKSNHNINHTMHQKPSYNS